MVGPVWLLMDQGVYHLVSSCVPFDAGYLSVGEDQRFELPFGS